MENTITTPFTHHQLCVARMTLEITIVGRAVNSAAEGNHRAYSTAEHLVSSEAAFITGRSRASTTFTLSTPGIPRRRPRRSARRSLAG